MELTFCNTCGAKRVRDVQKELSKLFANNINYEPDVCGICLGNLNNASTKLERTGSRKLAVKVKEECVTVDHNDKVENSSIKCKDGNDTADNRTGPVEDSSGDETDQYYEGESNSSQSDDDDDREEEEDETDKDQTLIKSEGLKNDYHSVISDLDPQVVGLVDKSDDPKQCFKCKYCPKKFAYINSLLRHFFSHPGVETFKKPFKCRLCGTAFNRRFNLKTHRRMHSEYRPFKCDYPSCTAAFKDKYMLASHKETHEYTIRVKRFKCEMCSKCFRKHSALVTHKRIHTGDRPFMCKFCGFCSAQKHNLIIHERQHTNEKPFRCKYCNKSFYQAVQLQQHEMDHTGQRPYVCEICGHTFKVKSSLKLHMITHSSEKPYKCDKCDYTSNRKENIKSHQRVHTTTREFKCPLCSQLFKHKDSFKKHEKRHSKDSSWIPRVTIQKKERKRQLIEDPDNDNTKQILLRTNLAKDSPVMTSTSISSLERHPHPQENNRVMVAPPPQHLHQGYPVSNLNSIGILTTHHQVPHHQQTATESSLHSYEPVDVVFNIL